VRRQVANSLTILALLACGACEKVAAVKTPKTYEKDGVHFHHPGNWKVTIDAERNTMRVLFIETPGNATVTMQIYSATDASELQNFAHEFSSNVQKEIPKYLRVERSTFGEPEDARGYKSMSEQFSVSALGQEVPHLRLYKQKHFGNKVIYMVCQVSNEDEDLVAAGFDQIMASLGYDDRR
jgi:hypothetical protein